METEVLWGGEWDGVKSEGSIIGKGQGREWEKREGQGVGGIEEKGVGVLSTERGQ